jgi:pyruvate/2-oxoglutarate dehydrogenase complex dihydrolipoamide dehydrogenase (E3) component
VPRAGGLDVRVRRHPFRDVGKALVSGAAEGFIKMLALPNDRVVGVSIFSDDAIDLIGIRRWAKFTPASRKILRFDIALGAPRS